MTTPSVEWTDSQIAWWAWGAGLGRYPIARVPLREGVREEADIAEVHFRDRGWPVRRVAKRIGAGEDPPR